MLIINQDRIIRCSRRRAPCSAAEGERGTANEVNRGREVTQRARSRSAAC